MEPTSAEFPDAPERALDETRISFDTARGRIESWLCALKGIFANDTKAIPRAIYIGPDDLDAIRGSYKGSIGIRVYFGLKDLGEGKEELSGMVVAVDVDGYDIVTDKGGDLTSIYDFTSPCPNFCDKTSIMHVAVPTECKD